MTDLSALGLTVQSDGLLKATGTLDKFTASSDKASAGADKLSGQSGKLDGALRKLDATAGGVTSEMQKLVSATTGVSSATGDSIADQSRHGQVLDDLRAKFNPLFAASRQYELQLREIAEAERLGAISAMEAAGARQRAAQSMAPGPIDQYSRAMGGAAMASANVFAQLNDIGMMMAAGQNPLQLAMQQGTQLNQVWGQMGGRVSTVGSLLRSAFMSMLNPLNLLTIGVIAGGAALVQWGIDALGGAGASAAALKADIENLSNTVSTYKTAVDDANLSTSEMRLAFGDASFAVGETLALLREIAAGDAQDAIDGVAASLATIMGTGGAGDARAELASFFDVNIMLAFTDAQRAAREEARLLTSQFQEQQAALAGADGDLDAQIAALSSLLSTTRQLAKATDGVNEEERALIASMRDALGAMVEQKRTMGEVKTELDRAKDAAVDLFNTAASNDWLSGAIGRAATLAETLWGAARAAAAAVSQPAPVEVGGGRGRGPGGPLVNTAEQELASVGQFITYDAPSRGASGGGGGGGASRVDEYTEAQKRALAVIADMNEAAVTQADVISALEVMHQSGAIGADQLATAIANVKEQMADVDKVSFSLSESLSGVFTDALTGAKDLQNGIKDLLGSMADLFLNAAFQKFLPTLLPGIDFGGFRAAGGPVSGGRSYVVGENGPELFTPGRSGGITPNHALGGSGTMVQINNYSGAPVREQRSRGPDGREIIKVIVGEELGGGGYDKQLGRYGATPAKVRR
jgi:hypothetical protein